MFRLDDATEQGVKYQKRFYKADERCKTLGVRVSDLQSTFADLKEKFQVSAEHISCLQKSALDIPSSFFQLYPFSDEYLINYNYVDSTFKRDCTRIFN